MRALNAFLKMYPFCDKWRSIVNLFMIFCEKDLYV